MTTKAIIDTILEREGGYVDNPADRGGPTKYGITLAKPSKAWRRRIVTSEDVAALGKDEARQIYESEYLVKPKISKIHNVVLRVFVLDSAVQHGPNRAIRWVAAASGRPCGRNPRAGESRVDQPVRFTFPLQEAGRRGCRILWCDHHPRPEPSSIRAGWANRIAEFIEEV